MGGGAVARAQWAKTCAGDLAVVTFPSNRSTTRSPHSVSGSTGTLTYKHYSIAVAQNIHGEATFQTARSSKHLRSTTWGSGESPRLRRQHRPTPQDMVRIMRVKINYIQKSVLWSLGSNIYVCYGRAGDRARRIRVFNAKAKSSSQANISDDCQALQAVSRQLRPQLHNPQGSGKGVSLGQCCRKSPISFR